MRDHVHWAQPARGGRQKLDPARGKVEGVDVLAEGPFDAGPKHLDRHILAGVGQPRAMHLGDGGGGNRLGKLGEKLADRQFQFRLDHPFRDFGGKRQIVLQVFELHRQFVADDIGARRKHLPELDVSRAKRGERARRRRQRRVTFQAKPFERPAKQSRGKPQPGRRTERLKHDIHRTGALQRGPGPDQPDDVVRPPHSFQPECISSDP